MAIEYSEWVARCTTCARLFRFRVEDLALLHESDYGRFRYDDRGLETAAPHIALDVILEPKGYGDPTCDLCLDRGATPATFNTDGAEPLLWRLPPYRRTS